MSNPTSGIIDCYGIRYNWGTGVLEMNTGNETWTPVPNAIDGLTYTPTLTTITNPVDVLIKTTTTPDVLNLELIDNGMGDREFNARADLFTFRTPTAIGVQFNDTDDKAILACFSTTQGFLPPAMDETQRDAIASPTEGLIIYNTTSHKLNVYTTEWEEITSAA